MDKELEKVNEMIDVYLSIFGNRWNLLILFELFQSPKRFNELKRALDPISQTVLTRHLKSLESLNVINRTVYTGAPVSVYYTLTEKGYSVTPSMIATYGWIQSVVAKK
jgi:DNA-binding HxlR family transcriptional regulator